MPIKNYTTRVPANQSIQEIQDALVKHGAVGFALQYDKDKSGRIGSCHFGLEIKGQTVGFALPVQWRKFQEVLKRQRVRRSAAEDYVYRVSWRCIRDWVLAQLALYETDIVELPQVFLPFAVSKNGSTLYEQVQNSQLLLN